MAARDGVETQRIDVWLWRARFFKTRSQAAKIANGGLVRLSRSGATVRIDKAAASVRIGDLVSFGAPNSGVRVVEVLGFGARRGPAPEAALLYRETSSGPACAATQRVGPRPTKKDRRSFDRLDGSD